MTTVSLSFRPPAPKPRETPLGPLGLIAALRRNPLEIWTQAHYEEPVLVGRTFFGDRAVVSDPAGVRRILLDNAANYRKDDLQLRILRPALGTGLLTSEGDAWRAQRRLLAPLFTPRQVAAFSDAMAAATRAGVDRLARLRPAWIVDMSHEMARLTLEILEHTLFSTGLGRDASDFQQQVSRYFETVGRIDPFDLLGLPDFLPRLGRLRGQATLDWFAGAVDDIVAARRRLIASDAAAPRDVLTLLLEAQDPETGRGMSEEDLRANIVTFIGAGHETTANALTWTLYLLSQSPSWRARVEAEADAELGAGAIDTLADRMPVTKAVLEESLRLYPPAAMLSRAAIDDDEIAGKKIPAGAVVTVSPFVVHRHRRLWNEPDVFDPERFLGPARDSIDRFAYIPFGAGPRVCIGMGFALQEAIIVLAHLAKSFRFDLAPNHAVRAVQRITLRPHGGMPMIVTPR
ncbi:MAG: cytochrome P450 [Hyphomicrobiales bacterium]|nr:cytochrome P450 [Hyphomicrobiales bacterium]